MEKKQGQADAYAHDRRSKIRLMEDWRIVEVESPCGGKIRARGLLKF